MIQKRPSEASCGPRHTSDASRGAWAVTHQDTSRGPSDASRGPSDASRGPSGTKPKSVRSGKNMYSFTICIAVHVSMHCTFITVMTSRTLPAPQGPKGLRHSPEACNEPTYTHKCLPSPCASLYLGPWSVQGPPADLHAADGRTSCTRLRSTAATAAICTRTSHLFFCGSSALQWLGRRLGWPRGGRSPSRGEQRMVDALWRVGRMGVRDTSRRRYAP